MFCYVREIFIVCEIYVFSGDHSFGGSGDEKENCIGHATLSRSWKSCLRDAGIAFPADIRKYFNSIASLLVLIYIYLYRTHNIVLKYIILFPDVSIHRIHSGILGLLYAMDRKCG